ncbi:MAG TPA: hypothetical protein VMV94_01640, partial [Phycisphaerae bacterium]|nr:hypothetical protein [Phycisphaerae bacterium]
RLVDLKPNYHILTAACPVVNKESRIGKYFDPVYWGNSAGADKTVVHLRGAVHQTDPHLFSRLRARVGVVFFFHAAFPSGTRQHRSRGE